MSEAQCVTEPKLKSEQELTFDFTVVIPAFNEVDQIGPELRRINEVLSATGLNYEIIVVDDGSEDGTHEVAEQENCRLIRQQRNMGYGASLKRGFRAAKSELVVITDADGTYPPEEIPRLLEAAQEYDMVVGSRTGDSVHIPLIRRPAKWFLRRLASFLAEFPIPDLNSGLRVIRREQVRRFAHILPSGFSFTTTITLAHLCNEMTIGYLPINYAKRVGASKIRASHAYHFLLLILRVIVLFNPLKVFLPVGAFVFVVGCGKLIYDIGKMNLSESAVMCLLTALVIWCVGLLADQNSRFGVDRQAWKD
ncbi:MAG: glycosyltransferase involved in cell wall biosynthesis [Planctomycetota bacterium]|jgi:glycosyltransferase involved in cell wall biosynthesis